MKEKSLWLSGILSKRSRDHLASDVRRAARFCSLAYSQVTISISGVGCSIACRGLLAKITARRRQQLFRRGAALRHRHQTRSRISAAC